MTQIIFSATGASQLWTVPDNVYSLAVELRGAGSNLQVAGGRVTGNLSVSPGDVLCFMVGTQGGTGTTAGAGGNGGWNGGGNGGNGRSHPGGNGGGGCTVIRAGGTTGRVLCVAGGAGGNSGDAGHGGDGGGSNGFGGHVGTGGGTNVTLPTPGNQVAAGHYGVYTGNLATAGTSGVDAILGSGGHGGSPGAGVGPGGGGGGSGYYPGGGGGAGITGSAGASGGAGGSGFIGSLSSASLSASNGNFGGGEAIINYTVTSTPTRPNTPSITQPTDGQRLKANTVTFNGTVSAPYTTQLRLALGLYYITSGGAQVLINTYYSAFTPFTSGSSPKPVTLTIAPLSAATHFKAYIYTQDSANVQSTGASVVDFYSNYPPNAPSLNAPPTNATYDFTEIINFTWSLNDDDGEQQGAAQIQWTDLTTGHQSIVTIGASTFSYFVPASQFPIGARQSWTVRTADPEGQYGPWADPRTFMVVGAPQAPLQLSPISGSGLDVSVDQLFDWRFRDPAGDNSQVNADIQFRVVGSTEEADWRIFFGDFSGIPGPVSSWLIAGGTLAPGFQYEWQVRTYDLKDGGATPSGWSTSWTFYAVASIGGKSGDLLPQSDAFAGTLGCGDNKAYLFTKGGQIYLGALTPTSTITWARARDDISTCTIRVNLTSDPSCCDLLAVARSWQHEIVIYRDDGLGRRSRVWEGPITRIEYGDGYVELEARDVMAWVYRRIMRNGYDDAYPRNRSIVFRSARIIIDALARDDPNILPYLTQFNFPDDALQSRVVPDYATTAWQEVDDMAAKAGLDYTTVGRRIILFDTHRAIGKLPVMRSGHFSSSPVVTEYGMNLATEYVVSNGAGIYGSATKDDTPYGAVELLVSAYGDTAAGPDTTLTEAAKQSLITSLNSQAARGIGDRWPTPLVVRVPDNSNIQPDAPFTIDQLIPGVWIPLQATHVCREFSQWQKLDTVTVNQTEQGETVAVVLSPAPNGGQDPDDTGDGSGG